MIEETTTTPPPAPIKKPRRPRAPKRVAAPDAEILEVEPDAYHLRPEFSASTAKVLIAKSPRHAQADRETPRDPSKTMDRGSVLHALVLGKGARFRVIDAADWRTTAAKEARDAAREQGLIPVLVDEFAEYNATAAKVRAALDDRGLRLDGRSELAVRFTEQTTHGPLGCRVMLDHGWLEGPRAGIVLDLKFTTDASPAAVEKNAENMGYAIQAAAYTRAITQLRPELAGRVQFLFAFCEVDSPNAINVTSGDGAFRELGERRWRRACETWAKCLETKTWPAYGVGINNLTAPAWALAREEFAS